MMTTEDPLHPVVAVGAALLAAGALGWLWFGDWRWMITGIVALLVTAVVAAVIPR